MIREGVARDEWRTAYVNTHDNEADLLTKKLPSGPKRKGFVMRLIHNIFWDLKDGWTQHVANHQDIFSFSCRVIFL